MEPKSLGVPLIFEDQYEFNKEILIPKFRQIATSTPEFNNYDVTLEVGNAGSTAGNWDKQIHNLPIMEDFTTWALKNAHKILSHWWHFDFQAIKISRSWTNCHKRGGWTNYHVHTHTDLVMAAYVQAPPDSGNLLIIDPLEHHWFGLPTRILSKQPPGISYPVSDNKVYFFAPFLRHGTEPSQTDEERWVISFNFSVIRNPQ